ncbi:nmrA-like family protein [Flagelloscypha sp. PMI_526]|nr:nmrA-like family protein [Flagelloscypha sp. PMI_526]
MTVIGIAGITGKFARLLTQSLLAHPETKIRGFCRDPAKYGPTDDRINLIKGEASDISSIQTFVDGCDVVVCCYLGFDSALMVEGQKLLIDACDKAGVSRYLASDWTLDYNKLELGLLWPKDAMKHVKAYLDAPERKVKGVHILIGAFMETWFAPFFGIFDAKDDKEPGFNYWGTGNEVWEGTTYGDAAQFTAAVVLDSSAVGLQRFLGGRSTFLEIVESFQKVYGVTPKLNNLGSLEDLYETMHARRAAQPENLYSYILLFYQYYMLNGSTLLDGLDNARYPEIKPVNWEEGMRKLSPDGPAGLATAVARLVR